MEDSWLEKEEFNFDIHLSPLHGESKESSTQKTDDKDDEEEEEVFFGPVGVMERCVAAVVKKDDIKPMEPLDAKQRAILLKESAALSVLLRHKTLSNIQNKSPIAVVHPMVKNDSSPKHLSMTQSKLIQSNATECNKENSSFTTVVKQEETTSLPKRMFENAPKRSQSVPKNLDKMGKSSPKNMKNEQMKLNVSGGTDKVKPRGIPQLVDKKSKIARPSSIPSLKQGLLTAQPKLRNSSNQESKLKPMKVVHSQVKYPVTKNMEKIKSNICNISSSSVSTPLSKENKRSRSSTGEIPRRRSSVGLSSSKLMFPKPNNNSTPLRTNSTSKLVKLGQAQVNSQNRSNVTPRKSVGNVSFLTSNERVTPKNTHPVARKSLLCKKFKQIQNDHSPIIPENSVNETRSNATCSPSLQTDSHLGNLVICDQLTRCGTFILDDKTKIINSSNQISINEVIKSDVNIEKIDCNFDAKELTSEKSKQDQEILIPEIAMKHESPLLKFDSPALNGLIVDPFAIGDTPPSNACPLLSPEQVQKDLIEW